MHVLRFTLHAPRAQCWFTHFHGLWALHWPEPPVIAAIELPYYMSTMNSLPANIPYLNPSSTNWATIFTCFCETMQVMGKWGYFDGSKACPMPKKPDTSTDLECNAIES